MEEIEGVSTPTSWVSERDVLVMDGASIFSGTLDELVAHVRGERPRVTYGNHVRVRLPDGRFLSYWPAGLHSMW